MRISPSPRRVIATATLLVATAGSGLAAHAEDQQVSTGHCGKSFSVSKPTTLSCSFAVSEDSHSFSGGGWEQPQDGSYVAAWTLTMTVAGQPQPLNSCEGVLYSGCVTFMWSSDPIPAGTVIQCTVHALGKGKFACDSTRD
jgi:hypothetical protein